jgi:hypothetical protein
VKILVVLAVAAGCGGKTAKPECKASADELVQYLRGIDHDSQPFFVDDDMHLAVRTDLPRSKLVPAPLLSIKPAQIMFQGQVVADVKELEGKLAESPGKPSLYLQIDGDAKWGTIAAVADAAGQGGFDHVSVVFARPRASGAPPPHSRVDDELVDIVNNPNRTGKASEIAHTMRDVAASCPSMTKLFGDIASVEGLEKADYLLDHVGTALVDCDCNVDMPSFRSVMWRMIHNPMPVVVLPLVLARDGTAVEQPASRPWSAASGQLVSGQRVWLVAR